MDNGIPLGGRRFRDSLVELEAALATLGRGARVDLDRGLDIVRPEIPTAAREGDSGGVSEIVALIAEDPLGRRGPG